MSNKQASQSHLHTNCNTHTRVHIHTKTHANTQKHTPFRERFSQKLKKEEEEEVEEDLKRETRGTVLKFTKIPYFTKIDQLYQASKLGVIQ